MPSATRVAISTPLSAGNDSSLLSIRGAEIEGEVVKPWYACGVMSARVPVKRSNMGGVLRLYILELSEYHWRAGGLGLAGSDMGFTEARKRFPIGSRGSRYHGGVSGDVVTILGGRGVSGRRVSDVKREDCEAPELKWQVVWRTLEMFLLLPNQLRAGWHGRRVDSQSQAPEQQGVDTDSRLGRLFPRDVESVDGCKVLYARIGADAMVEASWTAKSFVGRGSEVTGGRGTDRRVSGMIEMDRAGAGRPGGYKGGVGRTRGAQRESLSSSELIVQSSSESSVTLSNCSDLVPSVVQSVGSRLARGIVGVIDGFRTSPNRLLEMFIGQGRLRGSACEVGNNMEVRIAAGAVADKDEVAGIAAQVAQRAIEADLVTSERDPNDFATLNRGMLRLRSEMQEGRVVEEDVLKILAADTSGVQTNSKRRRHQKWGAIMIVGLPDRVQ
ncbi:hypothetical protein FPV67DRAFT_1454471 [Lyophyllum atratum]|nr:hypothetical protein FPV67DRAFT_1454468 [Lyophyllum atratum]KAF8059290.1 hypothetical protein FPV67DRAFT_1454471 [Lyophyllum atratum]